MTTLTEAAQQAGVTYDDLIGDLVRYGMRDEQHWVAKFPTFTDDLVRASAETADECPVCVRRFINRFPHSHTETCAIAGLLQP